MQGRASETEEKQEQISQISKPFPFHLTFPMCQSRARNSNKLAHSQLTDVIAVKDFVLPLLLPHPWTVHIYTALSNMADNALN